MRDFTQFFTHDVPLLLMQLHTRYPLRYILLCLLLVTGQILKHEYPRCYMQLDPRVFPPAYTPDATPVHTHVLTLSAVRVHALVFTLASMPVNTRVSTPVITPKSTLDHPPYLIRLPPSYLTRLLTQIYLRFTPRGIQQVVQESC